MEISEETREKLSKANQKPWSESRHEAQEEWRKTRKPIESKVCRVCGIEKPLNNFSSNKGGKGNVSAECKECESERKKKYYQDNREKKLEQHKEYYQNNKEEICAKALLKSDETREYKHEYGQREEVKAHRRKKDAERRAIDLTYRLKNNLRVRLNKAIRNNQKTGSAVRDLGCSVEELKIRLESMFTDGMTWENYGNSKGRWSIDHIIPVDAFDISDREQLLKVCHYTNLQPMWAIENSRKGNKILVTINEEVAQPSHEEF